MILSGESIRERIEQGNISIEPGVDREQIQPASLDIRLGEMIYAPLWDSVDPIGESLKLKPGDRILSHTLEKIEMPDDLAAQLTGRSSLGRLFVAVHQTAGWIDPSFKGEITLEIANFSRHQVVELEPGDRVGQMVFFQVDRETEGYDGKYQGDTGPKPSATDWEVED